MTLQNDDLLLVNRGGQSFKTEYGVLKENINEDQGVTISENAPADPGEGDLWYNSEDGRLYVWYVNETTGIVTNVSIRNGGSGYTTQETNVETAGGAGFGLTVDIDPGVGGNFANPQVNNGGHGYNVGDYIIVVGAGHQNGTLNVTAINTASVGQWVDASPDNTGVAELWERTGTTLSPATAGDSVDLGTGDLSAAAGRFSDTTTIGGTVADPNVIINDTGRIQLLNTNRVIDEYGIALNADQGDIGIFIPDAALGTAEAFYVQKGIAQTNVRDRTMRIQANGTIAIGGYIGSGADISQANLRLNESGNIASVMLKASSGTVPLVANTSGVIQTGASDARLKTNIATISDQTEVVKQLNPVTYNWADPSERGAQVEVGFIAQEVEKLVPEVVGSNVDGIKYINYDRLTATLTSALQKALTRIEALEAKVQQLEGGN